MKTINGSPSSCVAKNSSISNAPSMKTAEKDAPSPNMTDKSPRLIFRGLPLSIPSESLFHPYKSSSSNSCKPMSSTLRSGLSANQIFPWLYLGSRKNANDPVFLKQRDIRFILNVSRRKSLFHLREPIQPAECLPEIEFLFLPMRDTLDECLTRDKKLEKAFEFIEKARKAKLNMLVHCAHGISRSATIVIAFIMSTYRVSYEAALAFVKMSRPRINPNLNFISQLQKLQGRIHNNDIDKELKIILAQEPY
jgi:protein-tyrosine phosphatase